MELHKWMDSTVLDDDACERDVLRWWMFSILKGIIRAVQVVFQRKGWSIVKYSIATHPVNIVQSSQPSNVCRTMSDWYIGWIDDVCTGLQASRSNVSIKFVWEKLFQSGSPASPQRIEQCNHSMFGNTVRERARRWCWLEVFINRWIKIYFAHCKHIESARSVRLDWVGVGVVKRKVTLALVKWCLLFLQLVG